MTVLRSGVGVGDPPLVVVDRGSGQVCETVTRLQCVSIGGHQGRVAAARQEVEEGGV